MNPTRAVRVRLAGPLFPGPAPRNPRRGRRLSDCAVHRPAIRSSAGSLRRLPAAPDCWFGLLLFFWLEVGFCFHCSEFAVASGKRLTFWILDTLCCGTLV